MGESRQDCSGWPVLPPIVSRIGGRSSSAGWLDSSIGGRKGFQQALPTASASGVPERGGHVKLEEDEDRETWASLRAFMRVKGSPLEIWRCRESIVADIGASVSRPSEFIDETCARRAHPVGRTSSRAPVTFRYRSLTGLLLTVVDFGSVASGHVDDGRRDASRGELDQVSCANRPDFARMHCAGHVGSHRHVREAPERVFSG